MDLPFGFWFESPSTFTFFFWVVLWLWGLLHLKDEYYSDVKRIKVLYRLVNGAMIVGLVAFSFDSIWIFAQVSKFGYLFPQDLTEMGVRLIQNIGFFLVCSVFTYHLFKKKVLRINEWFFQWVLLEVFFFIVWFIVAPDPGFTDWTFALRNNYPGHKVLGSFLVSHLWGKMLQGMVFISLFNVERNISVIYKEKQQKLNEKISQKMEFTE